MYQDQTGRPVPYPPGVAGAPAAGGGRQAFVQTYRTSGAGLRDLPLGLLAACVSTGFGALQMLAPRIVSRTIGMAYPSWLIRLIGVRDLALGLTMLSRPASPRWLWTRVGNDLFDCGIIAGAAFVPGVQRRRLAGFAAFASGIVALDMAAARRSEQEGR